MENSTTFGRVGDIPIDDSLKQGPYLSLLRSLSTCRALWLEREDLPPDTIAPAVIPYWVMASYAKDLPVLAELPLSERIERGVPRLWNSIEELGLTLTVTP